MELLSIEKQLIADKREEYIIRFKDLMSETITLTLLPEYALITGGYDLLIKLGKNINPYMRLAELVTQEPNNDSYHYFKKKIVESNHKEVYDKERTQKIVQAYIKQWYRESLIEDYKIYKDLTEQEWDKFFLTLPFDYSDEYYLLPAIFKYLAEQCIGDTSRPLHFLLVFSEANYDRYRTIYRVLQMFFTKTITKEAITEYLTKLDDDNLSFNPDDLALLKKRT